jgi:hypothetical protein
MHVFNGRTRTLCTLQVLPLLRREALGKRPAICMFSYECVIHGLVSLATPTSALPTVNTKIFISIFRLSETKVILVLHPAADISITEPINDHHIC